MAKGGNGNGNGGGVGGGNGGGAGGGNGGGNSGQNATPNADLLTGTTASELLDGKGGDDTVLGGGGNDTLIGGTGNDSLGGGLGADLYLFNLGDGQDLIDDQGVVGETDELRFGSGIAAGTLGVQRTGNNLDLQIAAGDRITLLNWFTDAGQVEQIGFADGTTWTADTILQLVNHAPTVAEPLAAQSTTSGSAFQYAIPDTAFADVDALYGDTLSYSVSLADGGALPAWLSYDAATRTLSGTPGAGEVGEMVLLVTATDSQGAWATSALVVMVEAAAAPVIPVESRVNTAVAGSQNYPAIAALADGGYVVVYESEAEGNYDIRGQRFGADGQPLGSEFRVNSATTGSQTFPTVTALADGGFVVAWDTYYSLGPGGWHNGISIQRYDAAGDPVGGEIEVVADMPAGQDDPVVTALVDGSFLVVWEGHASEEDMTGGILARRYAADGTAGEAFCLNDLALGRYVRYADVAGLADGGFVALWQSEVEPYIGERDVVARRFDAAGQPVGAEFVVNDTLPGAQRYASVAALADGGYIVTWKDTIDASVDAFVIKGKRFGADGQALGGEFVVSTAGYGYGTGVTEVAALADGGFVVTWDAYLDDQYGNKEVYAQRFAADGSAVGGQTLLNLDANERQAEPAIAGLPGGGFVAAWEGGGQLSIAGDIYVQRYDAAGVPQDGFMLHVSGSAADELLDQSASALAVALLGLAGNDTLVGGPGNDILVGGEGADSLAGGAGADILEAGFENDTLAGGAGDDILLGREGADTYLFSAGDGYEQIVESLDGAVNVLRIQLAAGQSVADVVLARVGSGDGGLSVRFGAADRIELSGQFGAYNAWSEDGNTGGVQQIEIVDAAGNLSVLGLAEIEAAPWELAPVEGSAGVDILLGRNGPDDVIDGRGDDDALYGYAGNDTLAGGTGNDLLYGDAGDDVYLFSRGDGQDSIGNYYSIGGQDELRFGAGIARAEVTAVRTDYDLLLRLADGSDQVAMQGWFYGEAGRVALFTFDGQGSWSAADIEALFGSGLLEVGLAGLPA